MENFSKSVLTHDELEKGVMVFKEVNTSIASFTWINTEGFLRFIVTFEDEDFIILLHSHNGLPDEKNPYNFSVTVERRGGDIDLATDSINKPLECLIGYIIGAILKSETIIEFIKAFEDFSGYGFYKFEL